MNKLKAFLWLAYWSPAGKPITWQWVRTYALSWASFLLQSLIASLIAFSIMEVFHYNADEVAITAGVLLGILYIALRQYRAYKEKE